MNAPVAATRLIAEHVACLEQLPEAAFEAATTALIDCLGVMLAGSKEPAARILVLSAHEDAMHASRVLKAGAAGYLTKRSAPEAWIQAIRAYAREREPAALRQEMSSGAADIARIAPEIRESASDGSDLPAPPTLEPSQARFRFFDANASGSLINRVTGDVQLLRSFVDGVLIQSVIMLLSLTVYLAYMLTKHVGLTFACLAGTGDQIVAGAALYGGALPLLYLTPRRFGVDTLFVPGHDPSAVAAAAP